MPVSISETFKALGNPKRLALMKRLLEHSLTCSEAERPSECEMDPTCCGFGELTDEFDLNKATVSRHLKELRRTGLIERIQKGRRVYVRANLDRVEELRTFLDARVHAK